MGRAIGWLPNDGRGEIPPLVRHRKKPKKHKPKPCGNPPASPTGVVFTARATEALTHLTFTGKLKWNEVTQDEQGHGSRIRRYDIQGRAVDSGGNPVETEDGTARVRTHLRAPPRVHKLKSATNPVSTTFEFKTKGKHGMIVGNKFKVIGCKPQTQYNHVAGTPWVVTSVPDDFTIRTTGGASGVADCENPGRIHEAEENDDVLHIITGRLHRPRTWYWQWRVRAVDEDGCKGNYSNWTAPLLPWTGADPAPPVPTGLDLDFDKIEGARHAGWRARMQWNEIRNFDYPGTPADDEDDLSHYRWQVEVSNDDLAIPTHTVPEGWTFGGNIEANDDDADTVVRRAFRVRNPRHWFRFRVRSVDRFNRRSAWSAWTSWQRPNREIPPRPTDVTIYDVATDRIVCDWDAPDDPEDGEEIHPDIHHFQVQASLFSNYSTPYKFDKFVQGTRRAFKIPRPDRDEVFYMRVRSVNSDKEKSAWINATVTGNSDVGETPTGVRIGRGDRFVLPLYHAGTASVGKKKPLWLSPDDYRFIRISMRAGDHDAATHPNDGCPTGSALEANLRIHDVDDSTEVQVLASDTRLKIPAGSHKDVDTINEDDTDWAHTQILKGESLGVRIAAVGSTNPGEDIQINVVLEPI